MTYIQCLPEVYCPYQLKVARVVILLNSSVMVSSDPSSYRGISLLRVLRRVLKSVMVERLMEKPILNLPGRRLGFGKGLCTDNSSIHMQACVSACFRHILKNAFYHF